MSLSRYLVIPALLTVLAQAQTTRPPRTYDLIDVTWRIGYGKLPRSIDGDVTNTVKPLKAGTKEIWFDSGKLKIKTITVNGAKAKFRQKDEFLYVTLPKASGPKDTLKVRIVYTGQPEAGVYFITAEHASPAKTPMVYTQGEMVDTRYWLPTYDWPDDKASLECFITVPSNEFALSNGALLDTKTKAGKKTYHWKLPQPQSTYLISFVAGQYSKGEEAWDGIPVQWYVPKGLEKAGNASFAGTDKMVAFYSKLTGFRYPYAKFSQSAVGDYMFGGMENTTCVTQTINTLHPPESQPIENSAGLVAHELAHQWFGDTITCKDWAHAWVNEGFASFLPSFWFRESEGKDSFDMQRFDTLAGAYGSQVATKRPVVFTGYTEPINMFDGQIYGGGAARMFMLMHELGEPVFWKGVKTYLDENKFKAVDTEIFFKVMGRVAGKDLTSFKQMWFYSLTAPSLTVTRDVNTITIEQPEPLAYMKTSIGYLDNNVLVRIPVEIKDKTTTVDVPADATAVILDPDVDYMCEIKDQTNPAPSDLVALFNVVNAGEKMRLLPTLASMLSTSDYIALCQTQTNPLVLNRMIDKVKADGEEFLLAMSRHPDKRIQNTAIATLGNRTSTEAVLNRCLDLFRNDPNPALRNTALDAILKLSNDSLLADQAFATDDFRDNFRRTALRFFVRFDPDKARELCLRILADPTSEQLKVEAIGHLGGLKDHADDKRVFNALMKIAAEPSFGCRRAAIGALAAYGDKAAIPVIEKAANHSLHFMRNSAKAAIASLKARA